VKLGKRKAGNWVQKLGTSQIAQKNYRKQILGVFKPKKPASSRTLKNPFTEASKGGHSQCAGPRKTSAGNGQKEPPQYWLRPRKRGWKECGLSSPDGNHCEGKNSTACGASWRQKKGKRPGITRTAGDTFMSFRRTGFSARHMKKNIRPHLRGGQVREKKERSSEPNGSANRRDHVDTDILTSSEEGRLSANGRFPQPNKTDFVLKKKN